MKTLEERYAIQFWWHMRSVPDKVAEKNDIETETTSSEADRWEGFSEAPHKLVEEGEVMLENSTVVANSKPLKEDKRRFFPFNDQTV